LGLDLLRAIDERRFLLYDWYSPTLTAGRIEDGGSAFFEKVGEVSRVRSLKVADLSVEWIRDGKEGLEPGDVIETWPPGSLYVWESLSEFLRFNEEGPFLECMVSRVIPNERRAKRIDLNGIVRDVHTVALYKRLESVHDGVIELRVREVSEEAKSFLRIRSLKGQPHDARWHEIQIKPKGEAVLVS
jgi:KaiC/GvpD/RAD55 family RecA-like ATPase